MNRNERIAEAQAKIAALKPRHDEIVQEMKNLEYELHASKNSFDDGERVRVTETCKRGCCVENSYVGTIIEKNEHGTYKIRECGEGPVYLNVHFSEMERIA